MNKFLEERVNDLENEVQSLKVIVHQLRKPSTEVTEALAIDFEADADIIEFEGKQYRKVDREAREGDVIIAHVGSSLVRRDIPYKVENGTDCLVLNKGTADTVTLYNGPRTPETVDVYELIVEDNPHPAPPYPPSVIPEPVKTANQLRAEVIEKAKVFIEESKTNHTGRVNEGFPNAGEVMTFKGIYKVDLGIKNNKRHIGVCNCEFIVNVEKRTIVALLKGESTNKLYKRGIAKCMPSDVFNEHIGRAIALGRALGLDVSEFECAVQPTLAIGQIVFETEDKTHRTISAPGFYEEESMLTAIDSRSAKELSVIINDTNAQYGGVE